MYALKMDAETLSSFLDEEFPQVRNAANRFHVDRVEAGLLVLTTDAGTTHLRPGGTVSGPSLFALADVAAYCVILAHIGPIAAVVTTNMTMTFLHRPLPGALRAEASVLKIGARLAVAEVSIFSDRDTPAAHAVGTYAIPR